MCDVDRFQSHVSFLEEKGFKRKQRRVNYADGKSGSSLEAKKGGSDRFDYSHCHSIAASSPPPPLRDEFSPKGRDSSAASGDDELHVSISYHLYPEVLDPSIALDWCSCRS